MDSSAIQVNDPGLSPPTKNNKRTFKPQAPEPLVLPEAPPKEKKSSKAKPPAPAEEKPQEKPPAGQQPAPPADQGTGTDLKIVIDAPKADPPREEVKEPVDPGRRRLGKRAVHVEASGSRTGSPGESEVPPGTKPRPRPPTPGNNSGNKILEVSDLDSDDEEATLDLKTLPAGWKYLCYRKPGNNRKKLSLESLEYAYLSHN
jgi:hypothetical protein